MQSQILFLALGASLLAGQGAHAQDDSEDKFYVDLGYSRLGPNLIEGQIDSDPEFGGIGGHFGYRFSKHLSVEGEAMVGVENDKRSFGYSDELSIEEGYAKVGLNGLIGVYVKGDLPVTKKLNLFGRLGAVGAEFDSEVELVETDLETEETTSFTFDDTSNEVGAALGLGFTYDLTDKLYLRSDITRTYLDDVDFDSVSLGIGVRF